MRHLFFALLVLCTGINCFAANEPVFNAHDLSISWQALENDNTVRGQSLNAITITNNGKTTFPASGWKMYFNSARMVASATVTGNAQISFVNGDLFSLTPTT